MEGMMIRKAFLTMLFAVLVIPCVGSAHVGERPMVDVRVIGDNGGEFTKYRTYPRVRQDGEYFYLEAAKGERYSVEVANRSERRIGVVIAVDGRNIVSGARSYLKPGERMYIIDPFVTQTFEGWRTGMERTNRFYFTEQPDSYAEKVFSDGSAMGTIAVAVYRENLPDPVPWPEAPSVTKDRAAGAAPSPARKGGQSSPRMEGETASQAGTGFGETTYSPVRIVQFKPEDTVARKIIFKYEWRQNLCRKGIVDCGPKNRLWPDGGGFAPIPGDFRG
jgi:hypothetical protein